MPEGSPAREVMENWLRYLLYEGTFCVTMTGFILGFSLRKTGDYKQAYTYYRKALDFDPDHKGALEYLVELFVETGQLDKAKENVVRLQALCPSGCEELADLEKALSGATAKVN